jgi:hypothetical protein
MTKQKEKPPQELQEYIRIKEEHKEQYERKKITQVAARQRRQLIKELKEDRDWN